MEELVPTGDVADASQRDEKRGENQPVDGVDPLPSTSSIPRSSMMDGMAPLTMVGSTLSIATPSRRTFEVRVMVILFPPGVGIGDCTCGESQPDGP